MNDGGAAFPQPEQAHPKCPGGIGIGCGMSLRDWFAGQALANQYTQAQTEGSAIANWAYDLADAMLRERGSGDDD